MSDEITINARLTVRNTPYTFDAQIAGQKYDQATAAGGNPGIVTIGTAEEDVAFGDLVDPGFIMLRNLDVTNYVEYGPKNAGGTMEALGKLRPSGMALLELAAGVTLRMQANTAACNVQILAQDR